MLPERNDGTAVCRCTDRLTLLDQSANRYITHFAFVMLLGEDTTQVWRTQHQDTTRVLRTQQQDMTRV